MKHKNFNEVKPYTYFVKSIETGKKYYGVRYGNIKLGLTPESDLGKHYFTSGSFQKDFKRNPNRYLVKLHYTFDSISAALDYEHKFLTKVYKNPSWINKTNNRSFDETKIHRNYNRHESSLRSSKTMAKDIVNGVDMHHRRARKAVETKVKNGVLKLAAEKQKMTKRKIGQDGLSIAQRAAYKGAANMTPSDRSERSKRAIETFREKLKDMTDKEFEIFLKSYSVRKQKQFTTLRSK